MKCVRWERLPDCCRKCLNHESDAQDEYSPSYHYCTLNLIIPAMGGQCKRQKLPKSMLEGSKDNGTE